MCMVGHGGAAWRVIQAWCHVGKSAGRAWGAAGDIGVAGLGGMGIYPMRRQVALGDGRVVVRAMTIPL